ncbi:MAG: hypothetical protein UMR38_06085 [Candidatus Izemoplasma sp.]|nr:hypothetical protein [Candidatus Izemoplasma sp.]
MINLNVIVTGFGPFANQKYNPTKAVLEALENRVKDSTIYPIELPVIYDECFTVLEDAVETYKPDLILLLGVAAKRDKINLERVAINLKEANIPDNLGIMFHDEPIIKHGETAYFSTLDLKGDLRALENAQIPTTISNTAGTFVCNNIFYLTMHYLDTHKLDIPAGFIHVPDIMASEEEETINIYTQMIYTIIENEQKKEG